MVVEEVIQAVALIEIIPIFKIEIGDAGAVVIVEVLTRTKIDFPLAVIEVGVVIVRVSRW